MSWKTPRARAVCMNELCGNKYIGQGGVSHPRSRGGERASVRQLTTTTLARLNLARARVLRTSERTTRARTSSPFSAAAAVNRENRSDLSVSKKNEEELTANNAPSFLPLVLWPPPPPPSQVGGMDGSKPAPLPHLLHASRGECPNAKTVLSDLDCLIQ